MSLKAVTPGSFSYCLDSPACTSGLKFPTFSLPHMSSSLWEVSEYPGAAPKPIQLKSHL